ncbi:JNK1/MAPK8-associated membrane protein isoform X1 [Petromyzon marinus]|uniref:JNK1/MAPK8-associated membrane protein isoform X1 n=1 Tax=Petromyzon marinus TaxID=7757 RepID=A0AAJ7WN86_PETMA|nr:JNK1/MAPK8-associated membrane protein isoform X1 [Petromyzon marinus]
MRSESHPVDMQQLCPGIYCGRRQLGGNDTYSECGACPRGERPDKDKFCQRCEESPNLYDWLYLGFMAMLPLILHWFFIEWYSRRKSALLLHFSAVLECSAAAVVTLLLSDPLGSFHVRSCRSHMLSDWYTMLFNPSPDYIHTIHCTQEAVFPLYTIVFIYYAFCLVLMMVVRPFLVKRLAGSLGKADRFQSIYAALYFLPILTLVQAVSAGLLYFAFPFILLVFSIVTCAVYFALMKIVNIQTLFSNKRNLIVLLSHWVVHTYGIISITRLESLKSDLPMLALVPGPALFYLLTAKFTDPERIHSELNAG